MPGISVFVYFVILYTIALIVLCFMSDYFMP